MNTQSAPSGGKMVNSFDPGTTRDLDPVLADRIERRQRLLGPAYRLFYKEPLTVARGEGALLFDPEGNDYLDAYNNVVSLGHSHPRVVEAITKQLGVLCTHTRYVQESILTLAETMLPSFGGTIARDGHMMFTCTGSEANDLATRIAMHKTGKRGIIVTAEAYHGNSHLTAGYSPSLGGKSPLGAWVRRVAGPDSYRYDPATLGQKMAAEVKAQILELERHGDGIACFIADGLFSSDGIYSHPTDLLAPVAAVVREHGGLYIADEVQSGFARSGEAMWGYQRHGLDPDIVTMGKPMGNGYPVAGMAIRHEVIEGFGADTRYFNTFGGNTVAVAAAQAVFDTIRDEKLQENSLKMGTLMREGLEAIAKKDGRIGDVRGSGLYVACEFVTDHAAKTPDAATAGACVNGMREERVLISATGPDANILKIRPPLIFTEAHVDRLLSTVEKVLGRI
ncbi:aspartate aminotransferase family protein [Pseudooceanicola nanhaiensis]|uniref:aspartate aminotransferase family protein n=1 Tax=Pseudooceanicola nanhaiensis TaxID=375761 RepID=UPI001CD5DF90|nr:aspartate aminotransferase family protein [Pseudooceanicola nanhaiensis]MCA0921588.1 aspartate aminotransferase family protein [Pseudooceanicola nanhaiensis]